MSRIEIISLQADRARQAARLLSEAFRDNPGSIAILSGITAGKREKKLRTLSSGVVDACIAYGVANAVLCNDELAGISLAYPPDSYPLSFWAWLRSGIGAAFIGPRYTWRCAKFDSHIRKKHITVRHWYLYMLGVAPPFQGRGCAGKLLRRLSERADRDGVPCYLETDKPENVSLYQSFGYEMLDEERIEDLDNVRLWYMMRPSMEKGERN
ncbi:MAG: GNAT family N-acetyltransferase [Deltaproteobacteria bacterium]|nr:GNAT family N-acetyltransferase [Deltaproteobacteria bacterium]MBN2845403.1 GNAT family N-acetyltransferase [Deltaproteobacteria bacterium]